MAKKLKDTDYLFISTYLHSRERDLLTGARMERMIEAPTAADAAKVLGEIGYGEFDASSQRELGSILAQEQEKLFEDLYRFVPDKAVVDVFKVKYDYHNLKALIKARATGTDASDRLLLDAGRVSAEDMRRAVWEGDYSLLPPALRQSAVEAAETLSATGDPQLADFLLDRAYYAEMLSAARATGSDFLVRYVRFTIDAANLRSAVRTLRMKKGGGYAQAGCLWRAVPSVWTASRARLWAGTWRSCTAPPSFARRRSWARRRSAAAVSRPLRRPVTMR